MKKEKGFGLIELMISAALLVTILAGILLLQGKLMHGKIILDREDVANHLAVQRLEDVLSRYAFGSITTTIVNNPPLFGTITKVSGIEYLPECNVTDFDDSYDNADNGGNDGDGNPPNDYKEIKVTVTYPIRGSKFYPSEEGKYESYTICRYLYNTER
ncbi:MAG: prepilin-type N-terminal cleavage/methylation domain-containing protein [bacterium]